LHRYPTVLPPPPWRKLLAHPPFCGFKRLSFPTALSYEPPLLFSLYALSLLAGALRRHYSPPRIRGPAPFPDVESEEYLLFFFPGKLVLYDSDSSVFNLFYVSRSGSIRSGRSSPVYRLGIFPFARPRGNIYRGCPSGFPGERDRRPTPSTPPIEVSSPRHCFRRQ